MGRAKLEPRVSDHLTATIQPFILQLLNSCNSLLLGLETSCGEFR
jgi:hypothetical protein